MKISIAIIAVLPSLVAAQGYASSSQASYGGYETGYESSNKYCQVKGFPNQSFKVGCSYSVQGKFNCYDWDKMTLWCTSGGSNGRYVYCCGDACSDLSPPDKCGKPTPPKPTSTVPAPIPGPGPSPTSPCKSGYGETTYNKQKAKGSNVMAASFRALDSDCSVLDRVFNNVKKQAPKTLCANRGFIDGATQKYKQLQSGCVSDCAGAGKAMGKSLGMQYCAISSLTFGAPASGQTQQICSVVEQTVCEITFENYANENCPGNDQSFFNELMKSCRFTS